MTEANIKVERTGRSYSFASVEYIATMPNGHKFPIWSPPWAEDEEDAEKDAKALEYAKRLWKEGCSENPGDTEEGYFPWDYWRARQEYKKFFGESEALEAFLNKHWGDKSPVNPGYYWVTWADRSDKTIARFEPTKYKDGSISTYLSVQVVGYDELFDVKEFTDWIPIAPAGEEAA